MCVGGTCVCMWAKWVCWWVGRCISACVRVCLCINTVCALCTCLFLRCTNAIYRSLPLCVCILLCMSYKVTASSLMTTVGQRHR